MRVQSRSRAESTSDAINDREPEKNAATIYWMTELAVINGMTEQRSEGGTFAINKMMFAMTLILMAHRAFFSACRRSFLTSSGRNSQILPSCNQSPPSLSLRPSPSASGSKASRTSSARCRTRASTSAQSLRRAF